MEGRKLLADLILLDVIDFDMILEMDWLAQHYATLDCREKEVISKILNDVEFRFRGDIRSMPRNFISAITARKILRRGSQGDLVVVKDTKADKGVVENVPVVHEFLDVFLEELPGLQPESEIKYCIERAVA